MKKLLIVESPAKIKTIRKFLSDDFRIISTMGHIKDLPANKSGITMNGTIELEYVPLKGKEEMIAQLCKEVSHAQEVYIAPDPDREGEIIAFHVQQEIDRCTNIKNKKIYRISFHEITKEAVLNALENTTDIDMQKVSAQQARRVLDRWVGYEVSPVLWRKITKGLSAGRVQSVALRMICEREESIRSFISVEYWSITGRFDHAGHIIEAALTHVGKKKIGNDQHRIKNQKEAEKLLADIQTKTFHIDSIIDKTRIKNAHPPFMTSTLQQDAFNQLGFSVKKTMQLAQKLYEGLPLEDSKSAVALITYMRTDSLRLSDTALQQIRGYIKKTYDKNYIPSKSLIYEKKSLTKAQDAHEAIRPIDVHITPSYVKKYLPADAAQLYALIWKRAVASQMSPAQYAQRQVTIRAQPYTFKVTGSTLLFDGFLKVYNPHDEEQESKSLLPPDIYEKEELPIQEIVPKQHFTQPPAKYSEATLVKEMEKEGIGRPSTYATILQTIQSRGYVTVEKKRFTPTELGMTVTKLLVHNLPDIMDMKFTAHMEENLDKIASGELNRDELLRSFYGTFQKDLKKFIGSDGGKISEPTDIACPNCKTHTLVIRFGKTGEFLGCSGYPDCSFTANFTRDEQGVIVLQSVPEPELLKEHCPVCNSPLRHVKGKYGTFIACSAYPQCTYIHREKAHFACPECAGEIIKRKWRGGSFWGCSNYPTCKFAIFGDIVNTPCPQCKAPFLIQKKTKEGTRLSCNNKTCGYAQS